MWLNFAILENYVTDGNTTHRFIDLSREYTHLYPSASAALTLAVILHIGESI